MSLSRLHRAGITALIVCTFCAPSAAFLIQTYDGDDGPVSPCAVIRTAICSAVEKEAELVPWGPWEREPWFGVRQSRNIILFF